MTVSLSEGAFTRAGSLRGFSGTSAVNMRKRHAVQKEILNRILLAAESVLVFTVICILSCAAVMNLIASKAQTF